MSNIGGYGLIANGRSQYGAAASWIEPRFNRISMPEDGRHNVPLDFVWLTFELYFFSSFIVTEKGPQADFDFEISEDGGLNFTSIYALGSPYDFVVKFKDGQTIWLKIRKLNGDWPPQTEILIRTTAHDEFEQQITKVEPVRWSDPSSFPYGPGAL